MLISFHQGSKNEVYYIHSLLEFRATWLKISARWLSGDLTGYQQNPWSIQKVKGRLSCVCYVFKNLQLFPHQMPFQKQWSSFAFQYSTIFGYWNCFLSSVGKDGKDGRGLKLEKMDVLMLCLSKISKNILMVTTPNWNCLSMGKGLVKAQNGNVISRRRAQIKQLAWPMAEREIGNRKSSLVLFVRFPVVKWRSRSVAKSKYSKTPRRSS